MEVARPVEPGVGREARRVDHEGVALPVRQRVAHPGLVGIGLDLVEVDDALGVGELEDHHDLVRALEDLERVGEVHGARHARQVAEDLRVAIQPVRGVLPLPLRRPRSIRDLVAHDHAEAAGRPADRAEGEHRGSRHGDVGVDAGLAHHGARDVRLQVPVRGVVRLPDPAEIRLAVHRPRHPWRRGRLTAGVRGGQRERGEPDRRDQTAQHACRTSAHHLVSPAAHGAFPARPQRGAGGVSSTRPGRRPRRGSSRSSVPSAARRARPVVAGSGPRPSANARSAARVFARMPVMPKFPS